MELCTPHEKTLRVREILKAVKERSHWAPHSESALKLVIDKGINKYPKVNVRPFENLFNAPANW